VTGWIVARIDMKRFAKVLSVLLVVFLFWMGVNGCGDLDSDSQEEELGIQPTSVTLDADVVTDVTFEAWGGSGNYSWSVSSESLGTLVAGQSTAVYTNKKNAVGKNYITVTDGANSVSASVIQE